MENITVEGNNVFFYHNHTSINAKEEKPNKIHHHNLFEIYFITSGTCNYFINNRTYSLIPGDIILIPDGVIHNTEYDGSHYSRRLINCSRSFIPSSVLLSLKNIGYLYRNKDIYDEVLHIYEKIEYEYTHMDEMSEDILRCYTNMLFFLIARNENTFDKSSAGNLYIEKCTSYIQKNFAGSINLSMLAKMCAVSPEYLSRTFKKETGMGFCEYVNILRLQKAEQMIKASPYMSITEIAARCGFDDSNYFSFKFKKYYGITPKKMQLSYK